jgi:hypothetical protein
MASESTDLVAAEVGRWPHVELQATAPRITRSHFTRGCRQIILKLCYGIKTIYTSCKIIGTVSTYVGPL